MIKTIAIENVRGIGSKTFDLDIFPNKPSLLVAPNGFGKSSLAAAFAALKTRRMELPKEQWHLGDEALPPKLSLTVKQKGPVKTLVADGQSNTIAGAFDVHVVSSRLRAKATKHNMGRFTTAVAALEISDLILVATIPEKAKHLYSSTSIRARFGNAGKALRKVDDILSNPGLADGFTDLCPVMDKADGVRMGAEITGLMDALTNATGTADDIRTWAELTLAPRFEVIPPLSAVADFIEPHAATGDRRIDALLSALQVTLTYLDDRKAFKAACKYLSYLDEKQGYQDVINAFGATWKEVRPREHKRSLVVSFPAAMHISNGQRDSLCFAAELRKIERSIGSKDVIVVIDEVFDYLDDANLVAVQYYILRLIDRVKEKGRNIYPLILTHLNPYYFRHFSFPKPKVYFLKKSKPSIGKEFRLLLLKREDPSIEKDIGRHFLHYDPVDVDIRPQMKAVGLKEAWGQSAVFRAHIEAEWEKYVKQADNYDPFAVCCHVRVTIERHAYDALPDEARKTTFLGTWKTRNKLEYAASQGVVVDDTLYLLGLIYNDGMHVNESVDESSPIVSKLENLTVRHMLLQSLKA
ncbi:hypothetical protein [Luteibacter aegosomatissinici]|uniref:hypothetical protein n=1 Tax=Luteibacter aegosomatissinici TaxID=2911539 RepID=UPI001FF7D15C|nr:hypothetical protein [Luteibacter aegosomatissinici]UPG92756.1 hypothetical protein L2Y97_12865 [Luteibacter aegosomatissinici]